MAGTNDPQITFDRLYWMAVMKMRHDLNQISAGAYQALLDQTLSELDIDQDAFESYLDTHRDDLSRTMEILA